MIKHFVAVLVAGSFTLAHAQLPATGPAPAGKPETVALAAIKAAEHPCPKVVSAERLKDGAVRAVCSNGESFRVFGFQGEVVAMNCSAARKLGVAGC